MSKPIYVGYSSYEYQQNKNFTLVDLELVKLDLLNHLYTRRGERLMMPNFGTRIPDLVFEPLDVMTLDIIQEDLLQVINFDPRVSLVDLVITPQYDQNTVVASVKLLYIELNIVDNMNINIVFEGL